MTTSVTKYVESFPATIQAHVPQGSIVTSFDDKVIRVSVLVTINEADALNKIYVISN
jgi:hypothetical protein